MPHLRLIHSTYKHDDCISSTTNAEAGEPLSAQWGGCHGAHGVSHDAATPSLAGQDAQYLVSATKAYRDHTRHHDVMLDENSNREIENIAAFYAMQESKAAEDGRASAQQLIEKCDRCHGSQIDNVALAIPKISGQDREYLARALRAYRAGCVMNINFSWPVDAGPGGSTKGLSRRTGRPPKSGKDIVESEYRKCLPLST